MNYWLVKSEPETYSIHDLARDGRTTWEGIRNYQARNMMRDDMKIGDKVLFYHSNAKPPGVVGLATICCEAEPDTFAMVSDHKYFDPKATPEDPIWVMVSIAWEETFSAQVTLDQLKADPALEGLLVTRRGQRLSVMPVTEEHFNTIVNLGRR